MRILIWTGSFLPHTGGLETVTQNLVQYLARSGHEVRVVTNRYPINLSGQEKIDGVPVRRFLFFDPPPFRKVKKLRILLFAGSLLLRRLNLLQMRHLLKTFQPDVINVHFPEPTSWLLELDKKINCPLIVSLHGSDIEQYFDEKGFDTEKLARLRYILERADTVTACSRHLLDQAIRLQPSIKEKGRVIYNGIDLNVFEEKSSRDRFKPYVLAYGRFVYVKGFDLLIEAFANVHKKYPGINLLLAGEGSEQVNLSSQVAHLGLKEHVSFYGKASTPEVVSLLNGSEFVAIPSRREGFGIVALEGLAAGKLVLATKVGGLSELLQNSSNIMVEPTVEGIQSGLEKCLTLKEKWRIEAENRKLSRAYSADAMTSQYINVYGN